MKPHRLSDLLSDLYRRINPAYGPGRQKGEFVEALAAVGICPEHGNRGEEMETMVLVSEQELSKLRAELQRLRSSPDPEPTVMLTVAELEEFIAAHPEHVLRVPFVAPSPAPVVGGVAELTGEDIDAAWNDFATLNSGMLSDEPEDDLEVFSAGYRAGASRLPAPCAGVGGAPEFSDAEAGSLAWENGYDDDNYKARDLVKAAWAYMRAHSRLPALKPGEGQELRELERLCRVFSDWSKFSAERACAETEVDNCLDRLDALRAQATTEKEPDHA